MEPRTAIEKFAAGTLIFVWVFYATLGIIKDWQGDHEQTDEEFAEEFQNEVHRGGRARDRMLLTLPEACRVKKPVQDLIMETWPVLCIFGWHADPSFKFMKTTP